jgi:SpoVK/Ycf46/Vps4 family AAA+-type ATPase
LKRKFQTPKPRIGSNNNDQQHGRNTSSSNSNTSRGSHADTNNYNQNQNHSSGSRPNDNNAKEDDSDLPEELKGLDKELITKIENEIVDSGDPITFKDIAGLQDAKQTVMELVCWPMKRPDLFTGLRRGPNGLLL